MPRKGGDVPASRRARVLVVESNKDGTVGGSHQALFDLVVGIDHTGFEPIVLFHEDNLFVSRLRLREIDVVLFEGFTRKKRASDLSVAALTACDERWRILRVLFVPFAICMRATRDQLVGSALKSARRERRRTGWLPISDAWHATILHET